MTFSFFSRIVLPITPNSESDEGTGGTSSSSAAVVLCNSSTTTVKKEEEEDEDYQRATTTFRTDAEDAFEALIRSSSRANSRTTIIKSEPKTEFAIAADDRGQAEDYSGYGGVIFTHGLINYKDTKP
jgi:hypothetical protein